LHHTIFERVFIVKTSASLSRKGILLRKIQKNKTNNLQKKKIGLKFESFELELLKMHFKKFKKFIAQQQLYDASFS
jgi:hypothetical protein